jgi:hypothetical protein
MLHPHKSLRMSTVRRFCPSAASRPARRWSAEVPGDYQVICPPSQFSFATRRSHRLMPLPSIAVGVATQDECVNGRDDSCEESPQHQ